MLGGYTHARDGLFGRADVIVRDAEAVRVALVPADASGGGRWSLLGQSFGGFCAVSPRRPAGQVLAGMPFGQEQRGT